MAVKLDVDTSAQLPDSVYVPDATLCQRWADAACQLEAPCEVSLRVLSSAEIRRLNRDYRGKDNATNILSFPMELPDEVGLRLLGDLAACADVIAAEAEEQGKQVDAHWAHMIVHGMLHLQGHDHIEDQAAERMEALEIEILQRLGFDNPYIING